jgi:predicted ribosome quality control (RQC) complex YloA/Tae2 family protein
MRGAARVHAIARTEAMPPGDARSAPDVSPGEAIAARIEALRRAIAKAVTRIERRAAAVQGDLAQADQAEAAAARARLFVAEASRAARGAKRLVALDWSTGDARAIELPLDPARSAKDQLDAVFRRARRTKEGRPVALGRLEQAREMLEALRAIASELAATGEEADVAALDARATAAAPRDFKPLAPATAGTAPKRRATQEPLPPYRLFTSVDGLRILVGRGAAHNDELTLHVAKPWDLWLHAKGHAGAHVIVRLARGRTCTSEALVDAAHLAAHFSDARGERVVEIQYVPRRHVRKPRGSAPGAVVVDREKLIVLRWQEAIVRRLLDEERTAAG